MIDNRLVNIVKLTLTCIISQSKQETSEDLTRNALILFEIVLTCGWSCDGAEFRRTLMMRCHGCIDQKDKWSCYR